MPAPIRVARRNRRHRLRTRVTTGLGSWFTVNVGRGGFCVELMRARPVGEHVEGHIHLSGNNVAFAGRVAWAAHGDPRLNHRGRMGVCFVRVDSELARNLAGWEERDAASAP